jgi:hypothetical protein
LENNPPLPEWEPALELPAASAGEARGGGGPGSRLTLCP